MLITNRKSTLPRQPSGPGGPKSGGGAPVLVSDALAEVDVSDVDPPERVLSLDPELELDEDDDDEEAGSDTDVGPTPKLDSPGALPLQASVDTDAGATSVAAARKMRADMTARGYRGAVVAATRGIRLQEPRCLAGPRVEVTAESSPPRYTKGPSYPCRHTGSVRP